MPQRRPHLFALTLLLATVPLLATVRPAIAQNSGASPPSCQPATRPSVPPALESPAASPVPAAAGEPVALSVGYLPISVYAPIYVAADKGYYAEQGLDVTLESFTGGGDVVTQIAAGQLDAGIAGVGPGFWNAAARGLPLAIVAPGHGEGSPVATPLMISMAACEAGTINSVADLRGKRVAVNARGGTEYWLAQALATGGLTLDDIELQTLAFPDAVLALAGGAIDASMVGEPFATQAEQEGLAVRLLTDFPVQGLQPTAVIANTDFAAANPDAVTGLVTAYLKACRDLSGAGFTDPSNLAIIERYTQVPADLVAQTVPPVYAVDGDIDPIALGQLQSFFRERGQLDYADDLDPAALIDRRSLDAALATLGPAAP